MLNFPKQFLMLSIASDYNTLLDCNFNSANSEAVVKDKVAGVDYSLFDNINKYIESSTQPPESTQSSQASSIPVDKMTSVLASEFSEVANETTSDKALEKIIALLNPNYLEHPLTVNLAQQAIGAGLRASCDDFNPIMELSNKLPAPIHGLIAGGAAGLVQYLFNYPFFNANIQQIKQIEKYRLLLAIKKFYNSNPSEEELTKFENLKLQIESILSEQRHMLGRILQRQTKSMLIFNKITTPTTTPSKTTPTTNYVTGDEHIDLLNVLFQNGSKEFSAKIKAANNKIAQNTNKDKQKEYQILWETLNQPAYYRRVFKYAGRQTYLTPLEQIYSDNENKTVIQNIYLNSINKKRTDPLFKDEKVLYNFLKEKLDQITKINAIQTMHEIKIIIDIALQAASNDTVQKKKIADMYHNLMAFQFDVNHGHIFKIANQHNQNCAVLHASIIGLRYGLHNSSLNEAITNSDSAESVSRWMFFQLFGNFDRSGLVSSYISRTHTFNTCEAIHQQIIAQFTDDSDMEHRTIGISASELLLINQQSPTTTQDNKKYYYNRCCELSKQNGMILPNIIHEFLNNMGASSEKFNTTDILTNFGELATAIGIISKEEVNCSIHEFNQLAVKLFHGYKKNESQASSPQHPLISILLLFYLAKQDQNSNSKTEKLAIINRLIEKSTHDTSSLLYQTIKPSVLKYFAFEMSVAIITSTLYGVSVISNNPLLMPIQVIVNYFRLALNDADFLENLIRRLSTSNRSDALESIVTSLKETEQNEEMFYEFLEKNQFARSELEKYQKSSEQLKIEQLAVESATEEQRQSIIITSPASESVVQTYIDSIINKLNLGTDSVHLNRVMAIRNFVILLRIVLHDDDNNKGNLSPSKKISCLKYILKLLRDKKLSSQLDMEKLRWSSSFTKFENIIGAVLTLMPKFCGEVISNIISGTLIGASIDGTNSTGSIILRRYINKILRYSENYQQLIDIVEKEIKYENDAQQRTSKNNKKHQDNTSTLVNYLGLLAFIPVGFISSYNI